MGLYFRFGSASSFLLELFLHSSLVAYWAPTDLGSSSFRVVSLCLFILFMVWKLKKVEKTTRPFRYDLTQIPYDYTVEVRNRFKGLDLIDRVPDELWMEVHDIVQETEIKTIPKKKKCKIAKWLSEEALQIAVKRREVKSKGEKERYTYLNAEFQRIAKRDKKVFIGD